MHETINYDASIQIADNPEEYEATWRSLEHQVTPSFFLTWSWIGPWAQLVRKKTQLFIFTLSRGNEIIAMCFLTRNRAHRLKGLINTTQVRLNEYLDPSYNMVIQYNGILAQTDSQKIAWAHLLSALNAWNHSWDELAISSIVHLDADDENIKKAGLNKVLDKKHVSWLVALKKEYSNADKLLERFKSKSRKQLRQSMKAFSEIGKITLTCAETISQAHDYFDAMGSIHTARWERVGKKGSFVNQNWVIFHKDVISKSFSRGEILLFKIICSNTLLGYIYGYRYRDCAYILQTGFIETENNNLRAGYISHFYAMIYCAEHGMHSYDFLPDENESYKKFFTEASAPVFWFLLKRKRIKYFVENLIRKVIQRYRD